MHMRMFIMELYKLSILHFKSLATLSNFSNFCIIVFIWVLFRSTVVKIIAITTIHFKQWSTYLVQFHLAPAQSSQTPNVTPNHHHLIHDSFSSSPCFWFSFYFSLFLILSSNSCRIHRLSLKQKKNIHTKKLKKPFIKTKEKQRVRRIHKQSVSLC